MSKPPFIATQRLFRLTAPWEKRLHWVTHRFRKLRRLNKKGELVEVGKDGQVEKTSKGARTPYAWDEQPNRAAVLTDPSIRLLCVTEDAGMGKSKCLEHIEYLRMQSDPSHLCIRLDFARLPNNHLEYLNEKDSPLVLQLSGLCETSENSTEAYKVWHRLLMRKIRRGECTILVDALDQSRSKDWKGDVVAEQLASFLKTHPKVRCVVSGRPFAIQHYWKYLFAKVDEPWEVVQIDEFNEEERKFFLGEEACNALVGVEADLLAVPRSLETIRELEPTELRSIRTASDLYWKCHERGMKLGKALQARDISINDATALLALIAFEQVRLGMYSGAFDSSDSKMSYLEFIHKVYRRYRKWLNIEMDIVRRSEFIEKVGNLNALNIALDPGVLAVGLGTDPNTPTCTQLVFRNRTLQDFYAALWVTKYNSGPQILDWLAKHLYVRGAWENHFKQKNRYQFWKLACDMPSGARICRHYVRSMSTLFVQPGIEGDAPPLFRSTEMIYRAWWNLLDIAKLLPARENRDSICVVEEEIEEANCKLQASVRKKFKNGTLSYREKFSAKNAREQALWLVEHYLAEFWSIRNGLHGNPDQRDIALEFDKSFVPIPAGRYWYGDENPLERELEKGFELSRYPTMNKVMKLFDPHHDLKERFDDYAEYSSDPNCPAIYCDWYTSWSASLWLHGRLPMDEEWERACRGDVVPPKPAVAYQRGDSESDLDKVAWWYENSGRRTHSMGGVEDKEPNRFGLHHMLGNVWELTQSWYDADQGSRVLRGGGFRDYRSSCRSGYRNYWLPSLTLDYVGFRVSRAEF